MKGQVITSVIAVGLGFSSAALAQTGDAGRFVVTQAILNPVLDQRQTQLHDEDPQFIGRFVDISPNRLSMDGRPACLNPRRRIKQGSVSDLLGRGEAIEKHRRLTQLERYRIPLGTVPIVEYDCADAATKGSRSGWSGVTGFALPRNLRVLYWRDEILLVITPAARLPKPHPSFSCVHPANPSEAAICQDPSLANWDRSVAAAYKLLRDGSDRLNFAPTDDPAALAQGQRTWLAERNRCGSDRACLTSTMAERTGDLMWRRPETSLNR